MTRRLRLAKLRTMRAGRYVHRSRCLRANERLGEAGRLLPSLLTLHIVEHMERRKQLQASGSPRRPVAAPVSFATSKEPLRKSFAEVL